MGKIASIQLPNAEYTEKYGFRDPEQYAARTNNGLSKDIVLEICRIKDEPQYMTDIRLKALNVFMKKPLPSWGGDLSQIDFNKITYYIKPSEKMTHSWDEVPDNIRKTFERLGIPEAERKFLGGVGAQYECLSGDAKVMTNPKGPVSIKDIKEGDYVFALNEQTKKIEKRKVNKVMPKGINDTYELVVGTRRIKATKNHPFLAVTYQKKPSENRGTFNLSWRLLGDLQKGDAIAVVKEFPMGGQPYILPKINVSDKHQYKFNPVKIPKKTSPDFLWILGLFLGDGYIHREKTKARIDFAIPETDTQLYLAFQETIKNTFGDNTSISCSKDRLTINSTTIANLFEAIGISGNAHTKSVPKWVFNLPKDQILSFLGGYVDADGYVRDHIKNHGIIITSVNQSLIEDMGSLANFVGISTSRAHKFRSWHPYEKRRILEAYRMQISGKSDMLLCKSEQRLQRFGKKKWIHTYRTAANGSPLDRFTSEYVGFVPIKEITYAGKELVYDIEVDGVHNFVANGIIVHNSESVYHKLREDLAAQGVIFTDMGEAVKLYPEIVKKYFGTVVPMGDNKFAALNTAVWSGGSFIYVPKGVKVAVPLQAYFRINAQNMGQFERTLIIADEGAEVSYVEGCTAPTYSTDSLHAAVVEVIAEKNAKIRYTTIQNWSNNVYNLVTKRAFAHENAIVEWIDGNLGSKLTMKYPSVYLVGEHAKADILSVAYAGNGQHQDAGAKVVHLAPNTTSRIISKSISKSNGRASYRGFVRIAKGATNAATTVRCDALILDDTARSDTYPTMQIEEELSTVAHEAYVGRIGEEQLFYLISRGLSEEDAMAMIVLGFIAEFTKELPMEYAIELNKLIRMEMGGCI